MLESNFSERVRSERKRLGLSQTEFATLGGVKLGSQNGYENGKQSPSASYLGRLAEAGVDVQFIVTGARGGDLLENHEAELLDLYRAVSPDVQALIRQIAETFVRQAQDGSRVNSRSEAYRPQPARKPDAQEA